MAKAGKGVCVSVLSKSSCAANAFGSSSQAPFDWYFLKDPDWFIEFELFQIKRELIVRLEGLRV